MQEIEKVGLLFCPLEGHGFWDLQSEELDQVAVRFDARLEWTDGSSPQQSQTMHVDPKFPKFDSDLEWAISKPTYDCIVEKSAKVMLWVYLLKGDVSEQIGELELDIANEADQLFTSDLSDSRRDLAEWRSLKSIQMDSPKLLCSLIAEYQGRTLQDGSAFDMDQRNSSKCSPPQNPLVPILVEEAGYFLLGDKGMATDMFYFTIVIGSVVGISQTTGEDPLFISYLLFGNEVMTDPFEDSAVFAQEMATAKIFSDIESVTKFFTQLKPVTFNLCNHVTGEALAQCQADFAAAFAKFENPRALLEQGRFVEFNTVVQANASINESGQKPQILVRVSLGTSPDYAGTSVENVNLDDDLEQAQNRTFGSAEPVSKSTFGQKRSPRLFSTPTTEAEVQTTDTQKEKMRTAIIEKYTSNTPPLFQPIVGHEQTQQAQMISNEDIAEKDAGVKRMQGSKSAEEGDRTISSIASQAFERPESQIQRTYHKYRFILDVKSVGLVSDTCQPYRCLIRFKKWKVGLDSLKPPAVSVQTTSNLSELKLQEVSGILHEISFSAQPRSVRNVLTTENITVELWNESNVGRSNVKIGVAQFSLASLQPTNEAQLLTEPVMDHNNIQVGVLNIKFNMADLGEDKNSVKPAKRASTGQSLRSITTEELEKIRETAIIEIEDWKRNQKKKFSQELKELEKNHYKEVSEEWIKRTAERTADYERRMADLAKVEKEAVAELKKLRAWEKRLALRESQINAREAKVTQHEALMASKAQDLALKESELASRARELAGLKEEVARRERKVAAEEVDLRRREGALAVDRTVGMADDPDTRRKGSSRNVQFSKDVSAVSNASINHEKTGSDQPGGSGQTPLYGKSWTQQPPRAKSMSSTSSAGTPPPPPLQNDASKKKEELKKMLMKTNCYNENDAIVQLLQKQRRSNSSMN